MKGILKIAAAMATLTVVAAANAQRVAVQLNGETVYFPNAQAQYVSGRVLVPLRGVFEKMGAKVDWDSYTQTVTARKEGSKISLRIGDHTALVNGASVSIDVPPMILDGSTMVPIRFVSEALGAQVNWSDAQLLVSIDTMTTQKAVIVNQPRYLHRVSLSTDEIIPVTLDQTLSSVDNRKGDTFTATIHPRDLKGYGGLPHGTRIEGHIAAVHAKETTRPGILDLAFDRLRFPDGTTTRIDGTLISLDDKFVSTDKNGIIRTKKTDTQDQRMVYAGYGAGAGLLVGVLSKRPLEDTILGGALGFIVGQVQHDQRQMTNITLRPGTEMGVRLNRDIDTGW